MENVDKEILLDGLNELSDYDYQLRVWLASGGDEISSFVEAVCQTFDDSGLDIALSKNQVVIDEPTDLLLCKLGRLISAVDAYSDPLEIIQSEKMKEIRALARQITEIIERK